jgi:hypothetical protein
MFTAKYLLNDRVADYLEEKNKEIEAAAERLESAFKSAEIFFTDFPLPFGITRGSAGFSFTVHKLHEIGDVTFSYNPAADKWWYSTPLKASQNLGCLEDCFKDFLLTATNCTLSHIIEVLNERSR